MFYGSVEYIDAISGPTGPSGDPYGLIYLEDILEKGLNYVLDEVIKKYNKELFFTKHIDWRDELEYRWVIHSESGEPIFIPIKDCLKGVLIGNDCPKNTIQKFIKVCKPNDIPIYAIYWRGWNASVFGDLCQDNFNDQNQIPLNGVSFQTTIPCGGVFLQTCDSSGNIQPILIDTGRKIRLLVKEK